MNTCVVFLTVIFSGPIHHSQRPASFGPFFNVKMGDVVGVSPLTMTGDNVIVAVQYPGNPQVWVADNNTWGKVSINPVLHCEEATEGK